MSQTPTPIAPPEAEFSFGLLDVLRFIKRGIRVLMAFGLGFGLLGVLWALTRPVEYTSGVQVLPELASKSGGTFSRLNSLAGLAGLDLADLNATEAIRPDLYPSILQTTPFALYLLRQRVQTDEMGSTTLQIYLLRHKSGLSFSSKEATVEALPVDTLVTAKAIRLSKGQEALVQEIKGRVTAGIDKKSGIISISAKMPEAALAAAVAQMAMNYLTQYVTSYRTEKALKDFKFLTERTNEARRRYEQAQANLSARKDLTLNMVLNVGQDRIKKLQYDFDLAYSLYAELSKQQEEAKIRVQEQTPVFKIHEPPQVPLVRSEPKRTIIVLVFVGVGAVLGLVYLLIKQFGLTAWRNA